MKDALPPKFLLQCWKMHSPPPHMITHYSSCVFLQVLLFLRQCELAASPAVAVHNSLSPNWQYKTSCLSLCDRGKWPPAFVSLVQVYCIKIVWCLMLAWKWVGLKLTSSLRDRCSSRGIWTDHRACSECWWSRLVHVHQILPWQCSWSRPLASSGSKPLNPLLSKGQMYSPSSDTNPWGSCRTQACDDKHQHQTSPPPRLPSRHSGLYRLGGAGRDRPQSLRCLLDLVVQHGLLLL